MRAGAWVLAAVVAAGPAAADERWDGLYRIEPEADCDRVGEDGGAIQIEGDTFTGVDSSCEMTDPVDVRGLDAQLFTMVCEGEGTAWEERMMAMTAAEGDAVYLLWDGFAFRYERCPAEGEEDGEDVAAEEAADETQDAPDEEADGEEPDDGTDPEAGDESANAEKTASGG